MDSRSRSQSRSGSGSPAAARRRIRGTPGLSPASSQESGSGSRRRSSVRRRSRRASRSPAARESLIDPEVLSDKTKIEQVLKSIVKKYGVDEVSSIVNSFGTEEKKEEDGVTTKVKDVGDIKEIITKFKQQIADQEKVQ